MKKVALLFVCVNPPYWPFLGDVMRDARDRFLPGHQVDIFAWTDAPLEEGEHEFIIQTEPVSWPYPTLMRYHLFLQEEERLKDYDYIFYLDADMRIVDVVGDEILGEGLTLAEHPMYSVSKKFIPPYEPNPNSSAYIKRFGVIINENGRPWFKPIYAAGGFQGGTATEFLKAMRTMRDNIDKDFNNNYIAIWNDESHWNKYVSDYKGHMVVLSPSYIYPDSLIENYYVPIWGKNYPPKIVTLTKKFSTTKEGGAAVNLSTNELSKLKS